jgi:hypothetical protein
MPLLHPSKLPPPPELGEKTFWDYFPRRSMRRVVFLLIALGLVIALQHSGGWSFGGLFGPGDDATRPNAPVYHIKVSRPPEPSPRPPANEPKSQP